MTHKALFTFAIILILSLINGCASTYYNAMEKIGVHKRDILVSRIENAQEAQEEGKETFADALEKFNSVVEWDGGELEKRYKILNNEYEDAAEAAESISEKIDSVESVANALFNEWSQELKQYSNQRLRQESADKLVKTKQEYQKLIRAMRKAEASLQPVLATLRDNVLYLKHNLNAQAIASLKMELKGINSEVEKMNQAMQQAIDESNAFIEKMRSEQ